MMTSPDEQVESGEHEATFAGASAYAELQAPSETMEQAREQRVAAIAETYANLALAERDPNTDMSYVELSREKVRCYRQLRSEGPEAVSHLLRGMQEQRYSEAVGFDLVEACATTASADELGAYVSQQPGTLEYRLEITLMRIGSDAQLPQLASYVDQPADPAARSGEQERNQRQRLRSAIAVAVGLEQQAASEHKPQWQKFIATSVERHNSLSTEQKLTAKELGWMQEGTTPDMLQEEYILQFFTSSDDPDFGPSNRQRNLENKVPLPKLERWEVVENLIALKEERLDLPPGDNPRRQRLLETMTYHEKNPSPHAITLGLEVEVEREAFTDREPADATADERADAEYQRRLDFRRTEQLGVPAGNDAEWEFALLPAEHYLTTSRETQALMQLGLIPSEYPQPAHLTIGGITSRGPTGKAAFMLARGLEATGWSTSAERVRQPIDGDPTDNWLFKGKGGLKEREPDEISGAATSAVELRILEVHGQSGLHRTLRTAYGLGAATSAFQEVAKPDRPLPNADQQELAQIWEDYSDAAGQLFERYGMANPAQQEWTTITHIDPETQTPASHEFGADFLRFAELLSEAETPDTDGAKFQEAAQDLALAGRRRAMAVLDRTRPTPAS
jgi:hypothetical protein